MTAILGFASVSSCDQHFAGQVLRLEQAGAVRIFSMMSGKILDRPVLTEPQG